MFNILSGSQSCARISVVLSHLWA